MRNKLAGARKILQSLRLRHFQHPATRDLEQLVRIYGPEREKLARMRLLSRGGNKTEAQALARELFPQGPPTVGGLDIEYYQLMASTAGGGVQAQKQLQRLYRETGDARYRLAQLESQVKAGNLSSAVLSEFESLAQRADVNQPAWQDLWRRHGGTSPTNRASTAWIRVYRWIPGERAMLEQLAELQGPAKAGTLPAGVDPMAATRAVGRKALDREENEVAEKKWLAVLASRPADAEAQGSLGLVRLRQKRYAEAQEHFTRANQRDPQQKWLDLKKTAMLWGWLQMADTALANGDAELALAHVQQALDAEPKNASALRARAGLYARDGKPAQALALLENACKDDPELASGLVDIRVELMREQASVDANANRMGAALRMLETAVPLEPDNPWLRHQLARLYMQLDMPDQALDVVHEGVARAAADPEMRFARALVLAALADPAAALADLQSVAVAQRSAAMQTLEERVTVDVYIRQASSSGIEGLREVENMVGNDANLLYAVANAWFRHGLPHQGVAVYDRLAQRVVPLPPQAQLNHAVLRNRAQDDAALAQQLPGLLQLPDWTAAQEEELLQLTSEHRERLIGRLLASQQVSQAQQAQELARQPMPFQTEKRSPQALAQGQKAQARLLLMVGALAEARVLLERALPAPATGCGAAA
ncbi:MAG: tetratricopeptide repeat protein [Rhodoferax sp.]|nr:tetratricopeptide repeat protein [Rhodoferax sp.]